MCDARDACTWVSVEIGARADDAVISTMMARARPRKFRSTR